MDYSTMTIEQLRAEYARLGAVLADAQTERKKIQDIVEKRRAEAAARLRVQDLTPVQRDALLTVLTEGA